jgi:signal transduction histidine kinase/ligand-binding sensor domain-containing protein/DNA-binding response OmpR family regulator
MAKKVFVLVIACLLGMQQSFAQIGQFKFKHLNVNEGLSHPEIKSIFKDSRGFIWVNTSFALNRFDGFTVKTFYHDPLDTTSLIADNIVRLFEAPDGLLVVLTSAGLNLYNSKNEKFDRRLEPFHSKYGTSPQLANIVRDPDSSFWFVEPDKLIRYYPKGQKIITIKHIEGDSSSIIENNISDFAIDKNGNHWVVHSNGIAENIQIVMGKPRVVQRVSALYDFNKSSDMNYKIVCDKDGDLWLYAPWSNQGAFFYSFHKNKLQQISTNTLPWRLNTNAITTLVEAPNGSIWIGTDHGGINIIDKKKPTVEYLRHREGEPTSIADNAVTDIYRDDQGIMWVGTHKSGVSFYHENIYQFALYKQYASDPGSLPFEDINEFAEDASGNLWIGTNGGGLLYFDRKLGKFKQYLNEPGNENSLSANVIVSLCVDHEKNLWIGTFQGGLNKFDGKKFTRYRHVEGDSLSLPSQNIWEIFEDSKKRIWIGTIESGAARFDKTTGKCHRLRVWGTNGMQSVSVSDIAEDRHGNIWFGTRNGIDVLSDNGKTFTHYSPAANSLSHSSVMDIMRDSKGQLWIATFDGLNLFDEAINGFHVFLRENQTHCAVLTVQEDRLGHIWMSTWDGLLEMTMLDASENKASFKQYTESDGIQGRQFNPNAGLKTREGELVFGGPKGFNILSGRERKVEPPPTRIVFSELELYDKTVGIGEKIDGVVVLNNSISEASEIVLPPNKNFFSIKVSALNYFNPEGDRYMYKLEGLGTDWLEVDAKSHEIVFNSLNPGHYTLRVKTANRDGVWGEHEATLSIIMKPPLWRTKTAFAFYALILVIALYITRRLIQQREKLKFALEQERRETQRVLELDMMKVKFFTNVSHEFRTPLTLILTPIERLIKKATDPDQIIQFQMIQRNGKRLMKLVSQLLDFKKLEVNEIKFNPSRGDIIDFVKESVFSFSDLSEKKNIRLEFQSSVARLETLFDQDKLEKILFNLLSNAFKFTLENGVVSTKLELITEGDDQFLQIDVSDTGIGIPADKLDKIFEAFFQTDLPKSIVNVGSGIGLSITKEFVRIHGGHIHVSSEVGKGSLFRVLLPLPDINLQEKDIVNHTSATVNQDHGPLEHVILPEESSDKQQGKTKKKTLLLVEDNDDFRFYLKDNLKFLYSVHEARTGVEGWNQVLSIEPDLIVSDIMMPEMDGIQLCIKIKSDERVSHIPVILLTARSSEEQRLEGFKTGADDYITKPFNFEVLEARINNLLKQREKAQKVFRKTLDVKSSELQITPLDVTLIENAVKCVEKNVYSADFSVEDLGTELGISRAYVFKKIQALTGKTPLEFIRTIRLQHAAQLLEKSQLSVREIAYKVGFNNPRYFARYFKEQFNVLPSDYAESKRKENPPDDLPSGEQKP